ncbi:hypothetical protein [Vallitalea okinawensis]|uniref:hypothetical protein n=1 Tax=Vallitalea okinawensis TaxID=2078660 RepID=UPI000CFC0603|nr:hypothetical protein [Vallitalea okinawensis]
MKKHMMLILFILVLTITSILGFIQYKNLETPQAYEQLRVSEIYSEKLGIIKDIYITGNNNMLILGQKDNEVTMYQLKIHTSELYPIYTLQAHKKVERIFGSPMNDNEIISTYKDGLVHVKINDEEPNHSNFYQDPIENFSSITSLATDGSRLFYTYDNNPRIYNNSFGYTGDIFYSIMNDTTMEKTYLNFPHDINFLDRLDNRLYYTSLYKGSINLYTIDMDYGQNEFKKEPLLTNVMYVNPLNYLTGFCGLQYISEGYNVVAQKHHDDVPFSIATIPANTDILGGLPGVVANEFGSDHLALAYTTYNENHNGTISIYQHDAKDKLNDIFWLSDSKPIAVDHQPLVGPLYMDILDTGNGRNVHLLYFTYTDERYSAFLLDLKTLVMKDISNLMF